eukprot:scaffold107434_cov48-Phaeocystis_antarctica.AAC.1
MFNLTIFAALLGSALGRPEPTAPPPAAVSVDNTFPHLPGGKAPLSPHGAGARSRALWATDSTSVNAVCVDYSATAFYPQKGSALVDGLPAGDGLISRPATLSACELEKLHTECLVRINKYRSGALKFSDGTDDSNVAAGLQPLEEATGTNECSSQQAFGDLLKNVQGSGGCAGAHHTAGTCPSQGGWAQNSCCGRGGGSFGNNNVIATYEAVRDELFGCLQGMWDEGIDDSAGAVKGHWETMRSPNYQVAHCGFAFTASGRLMANQDFAPDVKKSSYLPCSCSGKPAGADDGCGSACVACSDPTQPACADDVAAMGWFSTGCSGDAAGSGSKRCTCTDHVEISWLQGCDENEGVRTSCPVSCNACPTYQSTCSSGPGFPPPPPASPSPPLPPLPSPPPPPLPSLPPP